MAHNLQVPLSFDLRIVKVEWNEATGRIVGREGEDFAAEVTIGGAKRTLTYSSDDLPYELRRQCDDVRGEDNEENDESAERICSGFHPRLFVSFDTKTRARSVPADAWQLRDAFLRVAPDNKSILPFLNRWGRWTIHEYVRLSDLMRFQAMVRQALVSAPDEWFGEYSDDLGLWGRKSEYPYFVVETAECETAIRMTVTIDLLRQVQFGLCARPDCNQPFSVTSAHKRKYCSQYCGHLESVRRNRARLAAAKRDFPRVARGT